MSLNLILKKEGLENVKKLDTMQINKIASNISSKLCKSFPELHLSQSALFIQLSRLDIYTAKILDGSSAKYFYGKGEIYFSETLNLSNLDITAIHECIHYLQEYKDQKGKLTKLGIYNLLDETGLALNEAAVQLIATRTSNTNPFDSVKYYGMSFISESPEFYPIECALLSQMMFFTGEEPLYFSTLYGSDMFQKTFINLSKIETYNEIETNFDKLLNTETELIKLTQKLQNEEKQEKSRKLQKQIENKKKQITNISIKIQNQIITSCFNRKFIQAQTYDDLRDLANDLRDFKDLLIEPENYTFYYEFCENIAKDMAYKKNQIIKYGKCIDLPKKYSPYMPITQSLRKISKLQSLINTILGH